MYFKIAKESFLKVFPYVLKTILYRLVPQLLRGSIFCNSSESNTRKSNVDGELITNAGKTILLSKLFTRDISTIFSTIYYSSLIKQTPWFWDSF